MHGPHSTVMWAADMILLQQILVLVTALSALVFTRLVSKAFSWGLDDRCSHAFCHAVIREQGRGRLIKEGFLLSVCLVSFPLIQRRTCSSVKRSQMYAA